MKIKWLIVIPAWVVGWWIGSVLCELWLRSFPR